MHNFIEKMTLLCLCEFNSDATDYVQTTQPTQTIQTNLYTICYRKIRRHISFFITPIILSSLIACGGPGGAAPAAPASPASAAATPLGFTSLRVTWDSVPQAERYEVYDSKGEKVATIVPPATSYTATGLSPNTEYTYSIKACNESSCSTSAASSAATSGNKNGGDTIINSAAELNAIRADSSTLAGNYILTTDIDLSSIENWQPIGDSANGFTGSFDGSGYEISGMTISGYEYAGLFGYVKDASISNLGVNVNNINSSSPHAYAGGLAAHANRSFISNVYVIVASDITSSAESSSYAGGLFGRVDNSQISNSYVVVYGSIYSSVSEPSASSYAEGLVGYADSSSISNSYYSASRASSQGDFTDTTDTNGVAKTVDELEELTAESTDWDKDTWYFGTANDLPKLSSDFVPDVEPPPVNVPASPGGVTVAPLNSTSIRVSWNSVSDVKFYRLYDNRGGAVINIAPPATSYTATDLLPNTGYTYRVAACNESGCSAFTSRSAATPVAIPASPSSISAAGQDFTSVTITWSKVLGTKRYEVYKGDEKVATLDESRTTYIINKDLLPATEYIYSVKACNDSGCSDSTEIDFFTPSIDISSAPQVTVVDSTIGQANPSLDISWNYISGVTSYQIFDAAENKVATVQSPTTNHIIAGLTADTLYEYKVRGCYTPSVTAPGAPGSTEICGDFSAAGSATTPVAIPATPSGVTAAVQGLTSIIISWNSVDGATSYEVYNGDVQVATIDDPATSYTVSGLLPATEYTYSVKACNTSGCSVAASAATTRTPVAIPATPSGVTAAVQGLTSIRISWDSVDGAATYQVHNGDELVTTINNPSTTSYTVSGLLPATEYTYSVKACNLSGCSDSASAATTRTPVAIPAVPSNVAAAVQGLTSIRISWDSVDGAEYYEVHNGNVLVANKTHPNTSYTATDLLPATEYTYKVKACNLSGCSDSASAATTRTPVAIPATPSNVAAAVQGLTSIRISWDSVDGAEYYEVHNGNVLVANNTHPNTSYTATDLLPNTEYTYSVKACNISGCSVAASAATTTTPVAIPAVPSNVAAAVQGLTSISISWNSVDGAEYYEVHNGNVLVANKTHPNTSYTATDLLPATEYTYKVKACNLSGCSVAASAVTTRTPVAIPAVPSNVAAAVQGLTSISISWNSVDGAEYYEVHNGNVLVANKTHPNTSYTVSGLLPATEYTYSVKACNTSGCSVVGGITATTKAIGVSIAPRITAVASTIGQAAPSLNVSWDDISGVTSYQIFDAAENTGGNTEGNKVATVQSPATSHIIADLSAGTLYTYKVRGCYASSPESAEVCGDFSPAGSTTAPVVIPDSPSSISAAGQDFASISIAWRAVSGATSYEVYKGDVKVATIDAPTTRHTAIGLLPSTEYIYSVKACNESGCSNSSELDFFSPPIGISSTPRVTVVDSTIGQANPSLELSWNYIRVVTSYQIFDAAENKVATVQSPATTHIITDLSAGTLYEYKVRGCYTPSAPGSSEVCGDFSAVGSATTPVAIPDSSGGVTIGSLGFTSISITWGEVSGATSYEVYKGDAKVDTIDASTTSYTATDLSLNTEYTYSVKACNTSGCSVVGEITATTKAIGASNAPRITAVASTIGQAAPSLNVSWDHISGVTSYQIFDAAENTDENTDGNTEGNKVATVQSPATSHIIADLLAGAIYTYKVRGCYASSAESAEVCGDFSPAGSATAPVVIPNSPSSISAGSLSLTARSIIWGAVSGATSYEVYKGDEKVATINAPTTRYTATALLPNTGYTYSVKACNTSGCSDPTEVSFTTDPIDVSDAPEVTVVTSTIGQAAPSLNVSWDRISGVTSYQIFDAGENNIVNISAPTRNHIITDLSAGTLYEYKVRGCYTPSAPASPAESTEICGEFSPVGSATTPVAIPDVPGNVAATSLGFTSIRISWDSVDGAVTYQVHNGDELVTTIDAPATSYTATGLLPNTEYTYRVKTCNPSVCSSTASATAITNGNKAGGATSIGSAAELAAIRANDATLAGNYALTGNINLSSIANWQPIGNGTNKFTGSFNGNGYNISEVSSSGYQYAGLFGYVRNANISNVGVLVGNISSSSRSYSGGLVGYADNSPIINSYAVVKGDISSSAFDSYSGGLVGYAWRSPISNSYAVVEGSISSLSLPSSSSSYSYSYSGGLVGVAWRSPISNSYAVVEGSISTSSSTSSSFSYSGGLVGWVSSSEISNSYALVGGSISSSYISYSGGLVGWVSSSEISNSYALVGGSISSDSYSGGLVGYANNNSPISNSYALVGGSISSFSDSGGLVGAAFNNSPISNSYAVVEGSILSSSRASSLGGLVGYAIDSPISNSYAVVEGSISSTSSSLSDSYSSDSYSGGLVGVASNSPISNSYAVVEGSISSSSSPSSSSPPLSPPLSSGSYSGGLVGYASSSSSISDSYAVVEGSISSTSSLSRSYSGGLVGIGSGGMISNSYYRAIRKSSEGGFSNSHGTATNLSGLRVLTASTTGWDAGIWDFGTAANLPILRSLPSPAPAIPGDVTATALGLTSISISWDSVDKAKSYEVHNGGALVTTIQPPASSYTATGLLPDTQYTYRVRACNLFGCSDFASASAMTMVFRISSAAELAAIRYNSITLAGDYALTGNIDLSDIANWQPIGDSTNKFTGSFDGNGYNISGVSSSGYKYAGLFGYVSSADISNVGVLVGNISSSSPAGFSASGGLVGRAVSSKISNSYALVEGSISSSPYSDSYSGGLVGVANESPISNSYAVVEGSISSSSSSSSSSSYSYSGGLVGAAFNNSPISNSYAVVEGSISASSHYSYSGGLVGYASGGSIINSYTVVEGGISSSSSANYDTYSGGLVAFIEGNSPISNSYYRASRKLSEGGFSNTHGTSQTVAELRVLTAEVTTWDAGVWDFGTDANLPKLRSLSFPVATSSLASPEDVTATALSLSSISMSWSNVVGATSYEVYNNEGLVTSTSHPTTSYTATGLLPATQYTYRVRACNLFSCSDFASNVSATTGATIGKTSAPQVTLVASTIGRFMPSLKVSWDSIAGVTSYQIFDATGNNKVATVPTPSTEYVVAGLSAGTLYEYQVRGCYDSGVSASPPESSEICGELSPVGSATTSRFIPSAPSGVTAAVLGITSLSISWNSVEGAVTYQVHNSGGLVATIEAPTTSYTARGLLPNKRYTYSVKACHNSDCSDSVSASATTENGITISSATELAAIRTDSTSLAGDYALTGNIDLSDIANWQPIGNEANKFTGSFDGNGYKISGVSSTGYRFAGLFGYVSSASISNVGVLIGGISSSRSSDFSNSGGLVGFASSSQISNSYAVVGRSISSSSSSGLSASGGLVGRADSSDISNSYAVVEGSISANLASGGLVGNAGSSTISNSYAVVGRSISSSRSSGNSYSGGLVGYSSGGMISNSYYRAIRKSSEGAFSNTYGTSQKLAELRALTADVTGWNPGIWDFGTAVNLPTLRSLPSPAPAIPGDVTATALSLSTISISWDSVDKAKSYEVHNGGALVTTIQPPASSYTATGLLPDTQYTYRVRACNFFGCSDFASASATTMIFRISSAAELAAIRTDSTSLARHYALTGNIDLSHITNWQPIGNRTNKFTGSFDGNGYNISGVSSTGYKYAGLFGYVENANISNVGVLVGNISSSSSSGFSYSGGLVGYAVRSPISNSYALVEGSISSSSSSGGLVGSAFYGLISNSYAVVTGNISSSSSGFSYSGALVGYAFDSPISNSYTVVEGSISSLGGSSSSGGLAGYAYYSPISNSYAVVEGGISSSSSSSSSTSSSSSGGLVGYARSSPISNSYALVEGSISSSLYSDSYSGGLVGRADRSPISNSYAVVGGSISSELESESNSHSGGLVGNAVYSPISNSYALVTGDMSSSAADGSSYLGGLVGSASDSEISNSYAVVGGGISSIEGELYLGGLVGSASDSEISKSYYSVSRKSSEGRFTNTLGTSQTLAQLRRLTADATTWDGVVWDFGTSNDLPTLRSLPSLDITTIFSPAIPGDFIVAALSLSSISISWGSVDKAASYEVYNREGLVTTIEAPATSYTATDLLPDTEYTYRVRACNIFDCSDFASASATTMIFRISSAVDLTAILSNSTTLARDYDLTGNIDLSHIPNWQPIGDSTNKFTGSFDGNGYNISGVSSSGYQYAGLFGYVEGANISNVGVLVGNISSSSRASYSGGLVGRASKSSISNSYVVVEGSISSSSIVSSGSNSGGLVGYAGSSPISNSYAVVEGSISSSSSGDSYSGGLVGRAGNSPISNSYAVVAGNISSSSPPLSSYRSHSGGLVGFAHSSPISNSYAVVESNISASSFGSISGGLVGEAILSEIINSYVVVGGSISSSDSSSNSRSGGLVGRVYRSTISNSYYSASRKPSEGEFRNTLGISQKLAELRRLTADATGWDGAVWDFGTDANLPTLRSLPSPAATRSPANLGDVTATALSLSSISMSWSSVVGATSYEVYNSEGLVGSTSHPATSYAATNLLPATQYTYRVRACNLFSCSDFASDVSATTDSIGVSSTPQVTLVASTIGRAVPSLKVSWDSIAGVTSYQIFDATGNNKVATVSTPSTEYVVAGLAAGTLYEYQVRGCYDSGVSASPPGSSEVCGELSEVGSATTSRFIPSAPSGVTATVLGITSLSISWNSVEGAVTYQVHNSGGLVATIDAPTTSYTTRDLLPNKRYTYSVKACHNSDCSDSVSASATTENGITIGSAAELAAIRTDSNTLAGNYALTGNINLSHISNWRPIGNNTNRFTGSFDGNGYNISGVSSSGYEAAGLFGYVENADISNVGVLVGSISSTSSSSSSRSYISSFSGGLVGYAEDSRISDSYAVVGGSISSTSSSISSLSGGLVGYASSSPISNSYAVVKGDISSSSSSDSYSGGLVGTAYYNPISNSYALVEGSISSSSSYSSYSGGLAGYAEDSRISNSYAVVEGSISSSSAYESNSGGLVGYAEVSSISNSYAVVRGDISSSSIYDHSYSGGLVGGDDFDNLDNRQISNSYAVVEGSISSSSSSSLASYSGGLVGYARGRQISNSYAVVEGSISSSSRYTSFSGGLVGFAIDSPISNSYAVVGGSISSNAYSGGLVGYTFYGDISNSYAVVGGSISSSSSSSPSSSSSSGSYSGGLVGVAYDSRISNSYAVVGRSISSSRSSGNSYSGGLVAFIEGNSPISKSYYSASRKSSEGGFSNSHGTATNLSGLRALTASTTGWDGGIWYFGTAANLPTLRSLPSPAPAIPGDVTATALGLTSISISWDSVDRATSYEVHNGGALVSAIHPPASSYTATDLLPDTQYTYRVRACNVFGCSAFASASAMTMVVRISSATELASIRTNSASLAGDYALTGNIDLSDISNWQPIGNEANKFTGSFDGNGYNISGVSSTGYQYAGLFGVVEDASISNIGVLVGSISSSSSSSSPYSGGLVGYASSSDISNSYAIVTGDISSSSSSSSSSFSGGLVGRAEYSPISNSYAVVGGSISSSSSSSSSYRSSYSGGLVGRAEYSPISNSYAVVERSVSSSTSYSSYSSSYSGGLVGGIDGGTISNSYAVVEGSISSLLGYSSNSNSYSGGLVGRINGGTISNSYALVEGRISSSSSSSSFSGGLVGRAINNSPISNSYYSASRKPSEGAFSNTHGASQTLAELRRLTASDTGWDAGIWYFGTAANLPTLRSLPSLVPAIPGDVTATALSLNSISMSWDSVDKAKSYEVHNGGALVTTIRPSVSSYTATRLLPDTQYTYRVRACNLFGCSDFASASATTMIFRISSAAELATIRTDSTSLARHYVLTGNIDLSHISSWQPIGDKANKFTGSFNGNGYNISGVSSSGYQYAGLFGYVRNANISNVGVLVGSISSSSFPSSSSSSSSSSSGGLVGYARSSDISNSYAIATGDISSSTSSSFSYAGGLVGYADNSPISNSYAVVGGNISSSSSSSFSYAGGLVGNARRSPISNSYAVVGGDISSSSSSSSSSTYSSSGGLIGLVSSSEISNSYAVVEGSISSRTYSGGLIGLVSSSEISNSYALVGGSISSYSSSGGLVGYANANSPISNSYALVEGSISSTGEISSSGGLVGVAFFSSPISNSYAVVGGNISSTSSSGSSSSGGLIGYAYENNPISQSYAVVGGSISSSGSSDSSSGGLVGFVYNSPIIKSYYSASRKSSEGEFSNTNGTSQTVAELRRLTADATGWDEGIWDFGTDNDLPTLRSLPYPAAILSPASPEDFTATALGLTSLSMSWGSVDKATSYEVYNSSGLVTTIEDPASSYTATGLLPEMEYTYRVRACNLFGCSDFASASAMTMVASISSAADLAAIRTNSNTLAGDYALTGNIDLSDISNWQPIGGSFANAFTGSFDGNGYNISGVSSSGDEFAGLFGYVDDANISNVGVLIGNILSSSRDTSYSGGLVSYASDSQISNSYAVVEGSISSSTARFNSYSGGLVGYAYSSQISNSYAVVGGNISSSSANYDTYSGGLVGWVSSSEISNSYAVVGGSISSSSPSYSRFYIGGLVGGADDNSPISNSYYSASRKPSEGVFTNTIGTSQTLAELRRLTADATGWDEVVWDFGTNNDLPILRPSIFGGVSVPPPTVTPPVTPIIPDSSENRDTDGDGTPDHVDTDDDDDNYSDALDVDDDGDGLIEIATAEQLNQVRHNLLGGSLKASAGDAGADTGCGGLNGITECNGYELVADISLAGYNSNNWLPIGSCPTFTEANVCTDVSVLFNAVFDGNGYTISNLTITNSIDSYTNATGLFGAISPASQLRNIHIRSANLIGGANNVGVLVGYAARASIIDSSAVGEITAYGANVGGLVGFGRNTTIISSYAAGGNIVGVSGVGGLVGSGERATISSSYAAGGDVGGVVYIGGLVGSGNSVTISLSYAAGGHVAGALGGAGGLVGSGENARVISSYAAGGNVSGFASIGGLIGSGENATIISSYAAGGAVLTGFGVGDGLVGSEGVTATDSYWDSDTTGVAAGIYGLPQTTSELQLPTGTTGIYTNWATDECDDGSLAWDFGTASQYPALTCTPNGVEAQRP